MQFQQRIADQLKRQLLLLPLRSQEHYESSAGKWITIGGAVSGDKKHAGGTPVKLDKSGRISAGPSGLKGKPISAVDQNKENTGGDPEKNDRIAAALDRVSLGRTVKGAGEVWTFVESENGKWQWENADSTKSLAPNELLGAIGEENLAKLIGRNAVYGKQAPSPSKDAAPKLRPDLYHSGSISKQSAQELLGISRFAPGASSADALNSVRERVAKRAESIGNFVKELESKAPNFPELPQWKETHKHLTDILGWHDRNASELTQPEAPTAESSGDEILKQMFDDAYSKYSPLSFPARDLKLKSDPERKPVPKDAQGALFDKSGTAAPPVGPSQMTPDELHIDPSRFQYKISGIDPKTGVAKHLNDAKYNPLFAGQLLVWHDPELGKSFVINGHHRHHLAKQSGYKGQISVYHIDAKNAQEARAIGALANMAGNNGTATDAAKFMRDSGTSLDDLAQHGISVSGAIARDAEPLSRLHPELFQKLTMGVLDQNRALAFSRHLPNPELQRQLYKIVSDREGKTKKQLSNGTVEEMAREMANTGTRQETYDDMFGSHTQEKSNFIERNEIKAHIRRALSEDKNAFRAVSKKKRNARLEEAGNVIDTEANAQHADIAARAITGFDKLSGLKGPLSDVLNAAADKYGQHPKQRATIFRKAFTDALTHIREELGATQSGEPAMETPTANPSGENADTATRGETPERRGTTGESIGYSLADMLRNGMNTFYREQQYYAKDAAGHEHKGTGPGGGQFTSTGGGGGGSDDKGGFKLANKPEKKSAPKGHNLGGKQKDLFAHEGKDNGQKNLFADDGVPDELVGNRQAPSADDLAKALAKGDPHDDHLQAFVAKVKQSGMSAGAGMKTARHAIEKHYPPANNNGHDSQTRHKAGKEYTPQRKLLHQNIISQLMHGVETGQENPEVHFMGGGAASGKSTIVHSGMVQLPKGHCFIDPDGIKGMLPEYKVGIGLHDFECARYAHEESSDLSGDEPGMLRDVARTARAHVVVDGVGNSNYDKLAGKVHRMKEAGYTTKANYVTVSSDEAVRRSDARAEKTGRKVPEDAIRAGHRGVSNVVARAVQEGLFDELAVYDTETAEGEQPIKIAECRGKQLTVHDQARWQKFLDKGKE